MPPVLARSVSEGHPTTAILACLSLAYASGYCCRAALDLEGIAWVIVGGESGPGARPMRQEWVELILQQCRQAKVPFFFKQWGGVRKTAQAAS